MNASAKADVKEILVAIFPGGFNWPLWVVKEHALDKRAGFDLTITPIRSSEEQMRGLLSGQFDIVMTGFDNVIAYSGVATRQSPPLITAFMGGDNGLLSLVAKAGLENFQSLKGRKIGVDSDRTGYAFALYGTLRSHGLTADDYILIRAGGVKQRFEALKAGSIDATLLVTPFDDVAIAAGAHRLAHVSRALGAYQGYVGAARTQWSRENRQAVVHYIRNYRAALDWLFNPSNKAAALDIYLKYVDGTTREQAQRAYDVLITGPNAIQRKAQFDLRGSENVVRLRKEFGGPEWSGLTSAKIYIDQSYYQQASR